MSGAHSHCCGWNPEDTAADGCGHVFEHDTPRGISDEEYDRIHCCPQCGSGPWTYKWSQEGQDRYDAMTPEEREHSAMVHQRYALNRELHVILVRFFFDE